MPPYPALMPHGPTDLLPINDDDTQPRTLNVPRHREPA